jgi:hypothetical protein
MSLALIVAVGLGSEPQAGKTYEGAWWNGVAYSEGEFQPDDPDTGPPRLVSHTAWRAEESPEGTLIRVGDGYLTADEKGLVHVSLKRSAGSYWVMKKVKTESRDYKAKDDWTGTWSRTTYTLEPTAPALRGGKLGFREGKLTVHPKSNGLAILAVTEACPREISGR